ncbi:MAG: hypothetical protein H5U02_07345 [Clostridia bacterium]|nr:hypothetical protein [Clostridia bacterium]
MPHQLAAHEILEAHEVLSAKTLCMSKQMDYLNRARDPELKDLIQRGLNEGRQMITQLQQSLT